MEGPGIERLEGLFLEACALAPDARDRLLDERCTDDPDLRAEVEKLLAVASQAEDVLSDEERRPAALPEAVGSYRILQLLGRGGMGAVYLAEQETPRRAVALKLVRQDCVTESAKRRFHHEVSTLGRLQHPGIAQIYDAGTFETPSGTQPYFAMELIQGRPLLRYAAEERLGTRRRLELFTRICDAVHHAHQKGVVHRDIKPSNVLVTGHGLPKVFDFGIAKATDADLRTTTLQTDVGQLVGTLAYMSPEQAGGRTEEIDVRTDVYALGVLLYELLCGHLPYRVDAQLLPEAIRTIREEDPTPLSSFQRALRGDVETIAAKALAKEPSRRYASAADLAADVRRYLSDEPILARPPSTVYQLRKFAKRNPAVVAAVVATFASLSVGVAAFAWKAAEADRQARRAENGERRALSVWGLTRLEELRSRARDDLWPRRPHMAAPMRAWLANARALTGELPIYEADLVALSDKARRIDGELVFDDVREELLFVRIRQMVRDLPEFAAQEIADIEARLAFALSIEARTVGEYADEWTQASRAIAESGRYRGLVLPPQLGLVPLGPDPRSGLWEFWHLETGGRPPRDESGRIVVARDSGLVLVLLPGGRFWMGSQKEDPSGPNYDLDASWVAPLVEVTLDPFFISKYEMTQGQWTRFTGVNPSNHQPGASFGGHNITPRNPVELVSWVEADRTVRRLGLELPTESQWEYACRAGTETPWWTGTDASALPRVGNLFESASGGSRFDGHIVHAPVGSFEANAFGLYDTIGNVAEWCRDIYLPTSYLEATPRTGDGFRDVVHPEYRVLRGSGHNVGIRMSKSAHRSKIRLDDRDNALGVRPSLAILR